MFEQIALIIASIGTFATVAVPFVIELFFQKVYQPASKAMTSVLTFIISIALTYGVWFLGKWAGVGFLIDVTAAWHVLLWGIGIGFSANFSWVNIDWIKAIIQWIVSGDTSLFDPKEPVEAAKPAKSKK